MVRGNDQVIVVELGQGAVRGRQTDSVSTYFAIPYAAPPIGALRFSPPEPVQRSAAVRDCTAPGAIAPQSPSRLRVVMGDFDARQDEDCLTLTIWSPVGGRRAKPVLVWLHGGAFLSGGGALDWYSGERLARDGDVVVVGVNYRLGALGFLFHPRFAGGNMALLDQQAALQWVHDNIEAFGGDPKSVTLCGQSAGAASIAHLLAMKPAKTLFHRCILQSAPLGLAPLPADEAAANATIFIEELGLDPRAQNLPEQLRSVDVARILSAQTATLFKRAKVLELGPGGQYLPFRPVVNGSVLDHQASSPLAAAGQMDAMIGWTREEYASFSASDPAVQGLQHAPLPTETLRRLSARRPAASAADLLTDHLGELMFVDSSLEWARRGSAAGHNVFVYEFDWQSPNPKLGSCHCIELPFVFGTWEAFSDSPMLAGADLPAAEKIAARMRAAWLAFVNSGNPSAEGLPDWPAFSTDRPACMRLGEIVEPTIRCA